MVLMYCLHRINYTSFTFALVMFTGYIIRLSSPLADDVMIMSGDFSGGSGFIASGDDGSGSGDAGSGSEVGSEVIGFEDTLVDDEDWFAQRKRQRRGNPSLISKISRE